MYAHLIIMGRLGNDPKLSANRDGSHAVFTVATNRMFYDQGQRQEETTWWRVLVFAPTMELCLQRLKKGDKVFIEAESITAVPFLDKDTDELRANLEVRAKFVKII